MTYRLELSDPAKKALKKLDHSVAVRVAKGFKQLLVYEDPSKACKALTGPLSGLWRYRFGPWRATLDIDKGKLVVLVLDVDHRSRIYHGR